MAALFEAVTNSINVRLLNKRTLKPAAIVIKLQNNYLDDLLVAVKSLKIENFKKEFYN
jgi:hypothetical protein